MILAAAEMPEDKFEYRASPESMSFAGHFMHIAWAMDWHSQSLLGGRKARDWETDTALKVDAKSKKEMIATIDKTFEETIRLISELDIRKFNDRLDYLGLDRTKLNGLKPPRYIFYQSLKMNCLRTE